MEQMEFYRNCIVHVPGINDPEAHETICVIPEKKKEKLRSFCSCCRGKTPSCTHIKKLHSLYDAYLFFTNGKDPWNHFTESAFHTLFTPFAESNPVPVQCCSVSLTRNKHRAQVRIAFQNNEDPVIEFESDIESGNRLLSRVTIDAIAGKPSRHTLIGGLLSFVITETEAAMKEQGAKTIRLAREESIWYRFAYHCYREMDQETVIIVPRIDPQAGTYAVTIADEKKAMHAVIRMDKEIVLRVLNLLRTLKPSSYPFMHMHGERELMFLFDFHESERVLECIPVIAPEDTGEERRTHDVDERCIFGNHIFVPVLNRLYLLSADSMKRISAQWHRRREIPETDISDFLNENESVFSLQCGNAPCQTDLFAMEDGNDFKRVMNVTIVKRFDRVKLEVQSTNDQWCTVHVWYAFGDYTISFPHMARACDGKKRYLLHGTSIVDCTSDSVASLTHANTALLPNGSVRMHRASLLQLHQDDAIPVTITGTEESRDIVNRLLTQTPEKATGIIPDVRGTLRSYQRLGVQWLFFLYDVRLGGLLCDDMGLGKTVQILGFFSMVREERGCRGRFLVVCPTTVIGHWQTLIQQFTPHLTVCGFYGKDRGFDDNATVADIVITSYGILRNEIDLLKNIHFAIAVFDEAHYLKNRQTLSSKAAADICAEVKLGLTGTPIENSLTDLKALFDIVLPGYLGSDERFRERFLVPVEEKSDSFARKQLKRLTRPFILRRIKTMVLTELPEKIEDERLCEMSDLQRSLYTAILKGRGREMITILKDPLAKVPYMHIFAILNTLRQICDHPVLLREEAADYMDYPCGKWELFTELLDESLLSMQKVVVFTNYLGMIAVMQAYLNSKGVSFVTLTGSTVNRKQVVDTFNHDESCRVFLGSLKAGGIGVDLTGGSVVIHYDRWWNAAREEQATDRVYRMGQKRGVQVFKLITRKSIEETMAGIIERKRKLSAATLSHDSPETEKLFTREELIKLLEESNG